jgi:uncharacterized protein
MNVPPWVASSTCFVARTPQRALIALVLAYRYLLKPWLGNACRFEPTCSAYTLQALREQGAVRGSALCAWRLLRCQPWCEGGHDPVPTKFPNPAAGLFTRLGLTSAEPHSPTQNPP